MNYDTIRLSPTIQYQKTALSATIYQHRSIAPERTLIYFHGGGLVYGDKEDLPSRYIDILTDNAFLVVSFDYPLAPEMKLPGIIEACTLQVENFLNGGLISDEVHFPEEKEYFLMGRSAGAFLCTQVASRVSIPPQGLGLFYGYYKLTDAEFTFPNRFYKQLKEVNKAVVTGLTQSAPITLGPLATRYPIYLYARQTGDWMNLLTGGNREQLQEYSLTPADLTKLPPAYITAATKDPDVPPRQSRFMANNIPNAQLTIIESNEHDFDRTDIETLGVPVYNEMIQFFKEL